MHIIVLNVIIGILIFIALVLCLRVNLRIIYEDKLRVYIRVLFFKYYLIPERKVKFNPQKHEKKQKKKENAPKTTIKTSKDKEKSPTLLENISMIREIIKVVLDAFSRHMHVKIAKMHLSIATPDAAQTAVLYGAVSGAIAGLIELIDSYLNLKKLKKCAVIVEPDFLSEKSTARIDITLSMSGWGAIITLAKSLFKFTVLKHNKVKQPKGNI